MASTGSASALSHPFRFVARVQDGQRPREQRAQALDPRRAGEFPGDGEQGKEGGGAGAHTGAVGEQG